jgi:hypothetical protein
MIGTAHEEAWNLRLLPPRQLFIRLLFVFLIHATKKISKSAPPSPTHLTHFSALCLQERLTSPISVPLMFARGLVTAILRFAKI